MIRIISSPNFHDGKSPTELLFFRPLKTFLQVLNPKNKTHELRKIEKGILGNFRLFKTGYLVYESDFGVGKQQLIFGWINRGARRYCMK